MIILTASTWPSIDSTRRRVCSATGNNRSGKGFIALLRRSQCLPRLRQFFASLPGNLGQRFGDECERLFNGFYEEVRQKQDGWVSPD